MEHEKKWTTCNRCKKEISNSDDEAITLAVTYQEKLYGECFKRVNYCSTDCAIAGFPDFLKELFSDGGYLGDDGGGSSKSYSLGGHGYSGGKGKGSHPHCGPSHHRGAG